MPNQLYPFNEIRFDRVMLWFSKTYGVALTQYDIVKLHVLSDINHVLESGRPIIGGALERWPNGPVVKRAYNIAKHRAYLHDEGHPMGPFDVRQVHNTVHEFSAPADCNVTDSEFSGTELAAMREAWETLMVGLVDWDARERYFHEPDASFIGKAYHSAEEREASGVDWNDIIDAYDEEVGTDHKHIKALIELGI